MAMETVKKRAACDECRARKLKCSGNRRGCDRCIRDRVSCYYSAQKRMGRPRKLRYPTLPEQKPAPPAQLSNPYVTPEPVMPHFKDIYFNIATENYLEPEWLDSLGEFSIPPADAHSPPVYELDWTLRDHLNNPPNDSHCITTAYEIGQIIAPVPIAPVSSHLLAPHTPEMHPHVSAPRIHISTTSTNSSTSFDLPSPPFTALAHMLGNSPPLPPVPPASTAGSSPNTNLSMDPFGNPSPQPSCDCIFNFFLSITLFKTHLTKTPIPFQSAMSTSRSAIATASQSLQCPSCKASCHGPRNHLSTNNDCISDMFLGALLPMLCTFYSKALESIELMSGKQKAQIEGHEIEIELETWKEMARGAMRREAAKVDILVDEMERISLKSMGWLGGHYAMLLEPYGIH
ncbi:hypothetical protein BDZ91DRAFT_366119 [Kalaharituber pfeilii]|nr:hypothetical protein BDZ91DRAFT_366119 [Kalaharituber pfeilii]